MPLPAVMESSSTASRSAPRRPLSGLLSRHVTIDWGASDDPRAVYVLGGLMVLAGVVLMYMGRGETFFYDEWAYVVEKFGGGLNSLLQPHSEHFSLIPIAIYKVLFHLAGINHYQVYRLVLVVMHLICVGLVFDIAKRRIGAWPALVAAALILFLFAAWQDLIWAFQISFVGSVAGGLAAWALVDRDTRRTDILAAIALGVALSSSGLGIPFVPGLAIELAWQRRWRRLWLVAIPFALYVLWYTQYGVNMVTSDSIAQSPQWILNMAAAGIGGLAGRDVDWGVPMAVVAIALALRRLAGDLRISPRLVGATVTGVAYWTLTGISRSTIQAPDESRYVYLGAVCVVVIALELLPPLHFNGRKMALAAIVLVATTLMGLESLHNNALTLRSDGQIIAAQLGALQLDAKYAAPLYSPSSSLAPNIQAGPYLHTAKAMGSYAGDSVSALLAANPTAQLNADTVLLQILNPTPQPPASHTVGGQPPTIEAATNSTVMRTGSCVSVRPNVAGAVIYVTLPAGGVLLRDRTAAGLALALRRFSPTFSPISGQVAPRQRAVLVIPADAATTVPWRLAITLGALGSVVLCRLAK